MSFKINAKSIDFSSYFNNSTFSDCTVESNDGQIFKLHGIILAQSSKIFKVMLTSEGNSRVIKLPQHSKILEFLFRLIYGAECELEHKDVFDVYRLSKTYLIHHVEQDCIKKLEDEISHTSAADVLIFAHQNKLKQLEKKALACIRNNFMEIQNSSAWNILPRDMEKVNQAVDALIKVEESIDYITNAILE